MMGWVSAVPAGEFSSPSVRRGDKTVDVRQLPAGRQAAARQGTFSVESWTSLQADALWEVGTPFGTIAAMPPPEP